MKKMYARLIQAPLHTPVPYKPGIAGNTSFSNDTSAGYRVLKNQRNSASWRLPKLAAVLILLVLTVTGINQAQAQTPPIDEPHVPIVTNVGPVKVLEGPDGASYVFRTNKIGRKTSTGYNDSWVTFNGNISDALIGKDGSMYVLLTAASPTVNPRVAKVTFDTVVNQSWIDLGTVSTNWNFMTQAPNGNFYITNGSNRMLIVTPLATGTGGTVGLFSSPVSTLRLRNLTTDANSNIYCLSNDSAIVKFSPNAGYVNYGWASPQLGGIASNGFFDIEYYNGYIYTAPSMQIPLTNGKLMVHRVSVTDSIVTNNWAQINAVTNDYNSGLALSPDGNLYLSRAVPGGTTSIYKIVSSTGVVSNFVSLSATGVGAGFTGDNLFATPNYLYGIRRMMDMFLQSSYLVSRIGTSPFIVTTSTQDALCSSASDGWAKASASGCSALPANYSYLWTPGNFTTDSIGGLTPGTYNVRVICGTDTVNKSVVIGAGSGPAAPATSNQNLCSGATVADLVATPLGGNTIKWYATATGGSPLSNSTPLVNGTKYYASQTSTGGCESSTRAADSVSIKGQLKLVNDTAFCGSSASVSIPVTHSGNNFSWMATQNGTGIAASGTTTPIIFTASNTTNAVKKDTVMVTSSYTPPAGYALTDGIYAFADTTGSTYLNLATEYASGNLSSQKSIGFNFDFYGSVYSNFYISKLGAISFDAAATKSVNGQLRNDWKTDASSAISFKISGTAPNRKLLVTFTDLVKPANSSGTITCGFNPFPPPGSPVTATETKTYTADAAGGRGTFQIILNETSNIIESAKKVVPSLTLSTAYTGATGPCFAIPQVNVPVSGNFEGLSDGVNNTYIAGRNNGNWIKLTDESKIFTPNSTTGCSPQTDTFAISVLPNPRVDSIGNQQVCPGGNVAAVNFTTPITGGTVAYKWINSNTSIGLAASGNGNLPSFTATGTGTATITVTPYMLKTATDTCFGASRTFTITADLPAAPTTVGSLVVYTGTKTLSQLDITPISGGSLNYYYTTTGGSALAGSTLVVDDTAYYITQTVNGCESNPRKQIKVNRIANDSAVNCNPAAVANLIATPVAGDSVKWFNAAAGGVALANSTALTVGENTLYVEEGRSGTDTLARVPGDFAANFNTIVAFDRGENDTLYFGTYKGDIYKANPDGTDTVKIKPGTTQINWITYRKEGADRFLYYTLYAGNDIKKYNLATGVVTTLGSGFFGVRQIDFDDANNRIFIADAERYKVKMLNTVTNTITTIDSFPGSFPANPLRPFAVKYSASNNKLYYNLFDGTNAKVYARDMSAANVGRTDSVSISQVNSISILPGGKLLIANSGSIYTSNLDFSNLTIIKTGLYGPNNPFFNSNNLLTYTTHTKVVREANIQSNRVPVTVIVNPTPNVVATTDQVVCNNSPVAAVNFNTTTTGGTVTYTWTNDNTSVGLAASGTGNIASFTGVNNGITPATATVIVTPTITNAGVSCVGVKDTFLIVVNPTANVNAISNQVVCNSATTTVVNFGTINTGGSTTYSWTNDNTSIGLAASGSGNIASFTAVNAGTAPVIATITVTPTFTNAGVSCSGPAKTFTITVNPTATVNTVSNQVVCNSSGTTAVSFGTTATGGTLTYSWVNNTPSIGLAASGTGNIASFTATNTTTAPLTATITVTPTFTNGGVSCTGTASQFTITVNPTATVTAISNKVECNGSVVPSLSPATTATGGSVTYAWANSNTAIGLAAGGTGNIPSFTATNTTTAPVTATITVTPTFSNGGVSCTGTPVSYTITVNPPPVFNAIASQAACNSATTSIVPFTTALTGGTASFTWTNNNTAIGLAASGSGSLPSFTATNNTNAPVSAAISVVMTYTNAGLSCISLPQTFNYVVNPTAKVNAVSNQTLCNRAGTSAISFSSSTTSGTLVYRWINNTPSIGLAASGTGNIPAFTALNNTGAALTATITVTPEFSNAGITCNGTPVTFTVTVNPTPVTSYTINNAAQCFTGNQFVFTNTTSGAGSYVWHPGDGSLLTTVNAGKLYSTAGTYTVKLVSTNSFGCMDSVSKTITVYPQPVKPTVVPEFGNGIHSSVLSNRYEWFNNNIALINSNNQYFYPVTAGYHQVKVTTINGCSETSDSLYYIPERNLNAGVDKQFVFVYPKPVTNGIMNIHFNLPLAHKVTAALYTDQGQLLQQVVIPAGTRQYKMDISKYPNANYVLRFDDYYELKRGLVVPKAGR